MNKVHLVMPMCGAGSRFALRGFDQPKPLLPLQGKPFFYWSTESVRTCVEPASTTFVILREHVRSFAIDKAILACYPQARLVVLDETPPGAVLTCLAGVDGLPEGEPVLFNDCDHLFRSPAFGEFFRSGRPAGVSGALLTFSSDEPKFSYLDLDPRGYVVRTVEKQVISPHAICGAYYFSDKDTFRRAAEQYLKTCNDSEYYLSGVYNVLAGEGAPIVHFPVSLHIPFGTPEEYDLAVKTDLANL